MAADDIGGESAASAYTSVGAALPPVRRAITQERIDRYRAVSGDHNRLHHDAEFASGTQFGGIIAHGMLTLGLVSELMAGAYGPSWLETGQLRVRFRGAARPGDILEATGIVAKSEAAGVGDIIVSCNVSVRNPEDGATIITGAAAVRLVNKS